MTLVNAETGEIVEPLSRHDAERLTLRITYVGQSVADGIDKLLALIGEARDGGAHLALGYGSWTAYVSAEFADILPRLDREPRRELVRELASSGMSTRAIAPVVGVAFKTVARDLALVHVGGDETAEHLRPFVQTIVDEHVERILAHPTPVAGREDAASSAGGA